MSCNCNQKIQVKYKKLVPEAFTPYRATDHAAGFDLTAIQSERSNGKVVYRTGLAFEIPPGYYGQFCPRSSIRDKFLMLTNGVGVIDADYRGEVTATFRLLEGCGSFFETTDQIYQPGERIGQLIILPLPEVDLMEAHELTPTERGEGGHGSTGA